MKQVWEIFSVGVTMLMLVMSPFLYTVAQADSHIETQYEIRLGDTLSDIALRFDVSVNALAAANNITNLDLIYLGHMLTIPNDAEPFSMHWFYDAYYAEDESVKLHVIAPGETLNQISRQYDVRVRELTAANHIDNPNNIFAGARLVIPFQ